VSIQAQSRHEALGLSQDDLHELYYLMLLTRRIDERMWLLQRSGKIPFVISPQGAEAAQIGCAFAFRRQYDWFVPYYRDLGVCLYAGMTPRDILLGSFARWEDPSSGGRQMAHHWSHRKYNVVSGSSPVTTQVLHAVGVAQAARMRGEDTVVYTACGEGSSNQGDFHEAANWAGIHNLGVIFVIQNNKYAISVPLDKQVAGGSVAARAAGYGFAGIEVDGTDLLAVYAASREAHERARTGKGPTLIEAHCPRLTSHSSDDDQRRYRSKEDLERLKAMDPILKVKAYLFEHGLLDDVQEKAIEAGIGRAVDDATDYAESAPLAPPEYAMRHVYKEG
jgi:2-oxoisovalerate dehydrogenase E1 component alpha subunit